MSSSAWPAVVDALIATLGSQLSVPVWDTAPVTGERLTGVIVGAVGDSTEGNAGTLEQTYHDLGPSARRDETGTVECAVVAQSGDDDLAAVRAAAFAILGDAEDALRSGVSIGVGQLLRCELTSARPRQGFSTDGVFCDIPLTLTYHALI